MYLHFPCTQHFRSALTRCIVAQDESDNEIPELTSEDISGQAGPATAVSLANLPSLVIDASNTVEMRGIKTCRTRTLTNDTLLSPRSATDAAKKNQRRATFTHPSDDGTKKKKKKKKQKNPTVPAVKRKKFDDLPVMQTVLCIACKVPADRASLFVEAEKEIDLYFSKCFRSLKKGMILSILASC